MEARKAGVIGFLLASPLPSRTEGSVKVEAMPHLPLHPLPHAVLVGGGGGIPSEPGRPEPAGKAVSVIPARTVPEDRGGEQSQARGRGRSPGEWSRVRVPGLSLQVTSVIGCLPLACSPTSTDRQMPTAV